MWSHSTHEYLDYDKGEFSLFRDAFTKGTVF